MKSLYNIILESQSNLKMIDGHVHLFDSNETIINEYEKLSFDKSVGFIDIEPNKLAEYKNVIPVYDDFIKKYYDKNKHVLLASGIEYDNIIKLYEKYPNIIRGFGEIKCYDYFKGNKIGTKKISLIKQLCEYSKDHGNLPIYIHYSLITDKYMKIFENLLKSFPTIPIVLCHCGMTNFKEYPNNFIYKNNQIYNKLVEFVKTYPNLWLDISYDAMDYFVNNIFEIFNLDLNRIILGTDLNPVSYKNKNYASHVKGNFNVLNTYINNEKNLNKLFNNI